jgi:hypothetical protein
VADDLRVKTLTKRQAIHLVAVLMAAKLKLEPGALEEITGFELEDLSPANVQRLEWAMRRVSRQLQRPSFALWARLGWR